VNAEAILPPTSGRRTAEDSSSGSARVNAAFLNAGIDRMTPLETLDEAVYDELFDVNVKGHLFTLQAILPLLGKGSTVVFNSSTASQRGVPGQSVYSATKGR
jgi:NAD(P)-dependent dehydrogenase (short-subunit alcohol dehydrogenase family)